MARLARLLEPGSTTPVGSEGESSVGAVRGSIAGAPVVAYCTDATRKGGALGAAECRRIVEAIEIAVDENCPVIGLWHSGGASLAGGVDALDGVAHVFRAMTRASGRVPQLSVVLGPAAGAAAYGPALTDIVIMASVARVFVTGPEVVRSVTGERIDMEGLGGVEVHSRKSGVAHITTATEDEAYIRARAITQFFSRPGRFDLTAVRDSQNLRDLLPEGARRAYDVRPLIREILDSGEEFEELQPRWAPNIVIGLGRIGSRAVGVVASNPLRKGGCLDSISAEKAARFVRMCDSFGMPLLVIVDVPGYLPGVQQEWEGIVRRGAKLLHAFAEATVPRVTLITRKSYGGGYIAMNSRGLGATRVLAWPEAEVAVMGAHAAVGILHRKKLAAVPAEERDALHMSLAQEHERINGGVGHAVAAGMVDEVIDPCQTRWKIAEALASAIPGRGSHRNIPL
ncbi:MAG TPA: carboxyl transferase domain-containing protein [Streptosporangiaceae bacterium]